MVRQSRNQKGGKENKPNSQNTKKTQSGGSSRKPFKREFKFFGHDSGRKNGYTYENIEEAIITKIQATFEGNTVPYVARSLRDKTKHAFSELELVISTATDADVKKGNREKVIKSTISNMTNG